MTINLTECPGCNVGFDTKSQSLDRPKQALRQQCPECGSETDIVIVNYPDGTYTVIGSAIEDDSCGKCGSDTAIYRLQRLGSPVEGRCGDCIEKHQEATLKQRAEL